MMKSCSDLMRMIKSAEGMTRMVQLYGSREGEVARQMERYMLLLKRHEDLFGTEKMPLLVSAPGRTELCGNHTDHNNGRVLAAAVNLDTVAAVSPRDDLQITLHSEGFAPIRVDLNNLSPVKEEQGTPASIIRGIAARMQEMGYMVRGFDGTATSNVLSGSGLSSSAAFEVLICAIFDALYNGMKVDPIERAKIAQYAENVYFGKPCGLMDQMASSVGGLVAIDFKAEPKVTPLQYDFSARGYSLIVVNTGGSHDDLTEEYGAIRSEMNKVAHCFGEETLRRVRPEQLWQEMPRVRREAGDRALLRALHYYNENDRVHALVNAVKADQIDEIKRILIESGRSSWMYLQNVYAKNSPEQPLCVALSMAEYMLHDCGAYRVHGGGFAGTTLNLVPQSQEERFLRHMRQMFGDKSCYVLSVRPEGATLVF